MLAAGEITAAWKIKIEIELQDVARNIGFGSFIVNFSSMDSYRE